MFFGPKKQIRIFTTVKHDKVVQKVVGGSRQRSSIRKQLVPRGERGYCGWKSKSDLLAS